MGRPTITIYRILDTIVKTEYWALSDQDVKRYNRDEFVRCMLLEDITVSKRKAMELFDLMIDLGFAKHINATPDNAVFDLKTIMPYLAKKAVEPADVEFYQSVMAKRNADKSA